MSPPTLIPQLADPAEAATAVDVHLASMLRGGAPELVGWDRPDPLSLYVPLRGFTAGTDACSYGFDPAAAHIAPYPQLPPGDDYLLRLYFSHYPQSPASAQFVNPATRRFDPATDLSWLPNIQGATEVFVHPSYNMGGQLICCSATLEFYLVNHDVEPKHQWTPGSSFAQLLNTLSRYLRPDTYQGRQG